MIDDLKIRQICPSDNQIIANIIRSALIEFGGNKPGTAFYDYDTDHMFEAYQKPGQIYLVAELENRLVGGSGIKQLANGNQDTCELQKLYINAKARGLGIGKQLLEQCLEFAKKTSYNQCYLETFPNMHAAINLYKKYGFYELKAPIGNTGHCGCDVWMLKYL